MAEKVIGCLPELSSTGDFYCSEDVEVIIQSMYVILSTPLDSRKWQPAFGCDLLKYLFEPKTDDILDSIKSTVKNALEQWEPRAVITSITADYAQESISVNAITLRVDFMYRSRNYSHTFVIGADPEMLNLSVYDLKIDKSV